MSIQISGVRISGLKILWLFANLAVIVLSYKVDSLGQQCVGVASKGVKDLINTLKSALRSRAGFAEEGVPVIADNSLGVNPLKVAEALRSQGINARSVGEIFGKDPGDAAIKQIADHLGGKVVAVDRGRQITGGFGRATIRVDGRVREVDTVIRIVTEALKSAE